MVEKEAAAAAGVGAVGSSSLLEEAPSQLSQTDPAVRAFVCHFLWEKVSKRMEVQSISIPNLH